MGGRREVSPPLRPLSSAESSYSDSSDGYPTRSKERWRSGGSHSHHRSHHYKSYKKQRHESSSHDGNRSRHHHRRRNESRRTAIALRISSSSSSKSRSTSASTSGDNERDEARAEVKPQSDWVCGVCSNLNSTQRSDCYRCEATYVQSRRARPSAEVCIHGVPDDCTSQDLEAALKDAFVRHGELLDVSIGVEKHGTVWYVRFPSSFECTKALIFCHCRLPLGNTSCSMEFSKKSKGATSAYRISPDQQASHEVGALSKTVEQLPFELQPSHWKPPSDFSSVKARKDYLETLSAHWQYLSETQKVYYDEEVKQVLLHPSANVQNAEQEREENLGVASMKKDSAVSAEATPNPIEALKRKLEEKKKELSKEISGPQLPNNRNSGSKPTKASTTSDAVLQLKQRLAQKKAQIAADGRHSRSTNTTPNAPDKNVTNGKQNNCSNDKACSGDGVGPSVTQPLRYIHGFPVPPLYNVEKSLSNGTISFHCIPSAVASRVLPLYLSNVLSDGK
ncbi:unnamed protein product [Phytomonas sp. EM1]|nr:unnamed protein product [Phytomonas sp. EM1]|eukprot:CCW59542.1 unnamed protein product [Phytomonas sp. isolate EM1]